MHPSAATAVLLPIARRACPRRAAHGAASLVVVMVLFFILALVSATSSRKVLAEQLKATFDASSVKAASINAAMVDYALVLLNSGRVDESCAPTSSPSGKDFRDLGPEVLADGWLRTRQLSWVHALVCTSSVESRSGLRCRCTTPPTAAARTANGGGDFAALASSQATNETAGRLSVTTTYNVCDPVTGRCDGRPGSLTLAAMSCARGGAAASGMRCASDSNYRMALDGNYVENTRLSLLPDLPLMPTAALTVASSFVPGAARITLVNTDSRAARSIHLGTDLPGSGNYAFQSATGAGSAGSVDNDASLLALVPSDPALLWTSQDRMFRAMFQTDAPTFRARPATIKVDCSATCSYSDLVALRAAFPRRTLWFDGDLSIGPGAPATLGSLDDPLLLVVKGRLSIDSGSTLRGFAYAQNITWGAGGAGATFVGALVAVQQFRAEGDVRIVWDEPTLNRLKSFYGSWVRLPNSIN